MFVYKRRWIITFVGLLALALLATTPVHGSTQPLLTKVRAHAETSPITTRNSDDMPYLHIKIGSEFTDTFIKYKYEEIPYTFKNGRTAPVCMVTYEDDQRRGQLHDLGCDGTTDAVRRGGEFTGADAQQYAPLYASLLSDLHELLSAISRFDSPPQGVGPRDVVDASRQVENLEVDWNDRNRFQVMASNGHWYAHDFIDNGGRFIVGCRVLERRDEVTITGTSVACRGGVRRGTRQIKRGEASAYRPSADEFAAMLSRSKLLMEAAATISPDEGQSRTRTLAADVFPAHQRQASAAGRALERARTLTIDTNISKNDGEGRNAYLIIPSDAGRVLYRLYTFESFSGVHCQTWFQAKDYYRIYIDRGCSGTPNLAQVGRDSTFNRVTDNAHTAFYKARLGEFADYLTTLQQTNHSSVTRGILHIWGDANAGEITDDGADIVQYIFSNDYTFRFMRTADNDCYLTHKTPEGKNLLLDQRCDNLIAAGQAYDARGNKVPTSYVPRRVYKQIAGYIFAFTKLTARYHPAH